MKVDMYKKVPESFHNQLLETLDQLPEEKKQSFAGNRSRKWIVLAAAAVLVLGTMTAAATEIFKWNEQAKKHFGVSDDVEDELTMDGVTRQEEAVIQEQGFEFRLIQSVRTGNSCYYLCQVTVPEGVAIDENTVFEECSVEADVETNGCVADFVYDEQKKDQLLLEIEVLTRDGIDYEGKEAVIHLTNLVQTEKTEIQEILAEGEWEIPVTLPGGTEDVVYEVNQKIAFGEHELLIKKIRAGAFGLRMYMEQEESLHALMYYGVSLTRVRSADGSLTEQEVGINKFYHTDDHTGEFYYEITLEQAIDPAKVAGLVFNHGEIELSFSGESRIQTTENMTDRWTAGERPEDAQVLYERHGNAVYTDGSYLYLQDITCGKISRLLDLSELSYDQEKGGEIVPFSVTMAYILPYEGSDIMYVYGLVQDEKGEHLLSEVPAESVLESDYYEIQRGYMLEYSEQN